MSDKTEESSGTELVPSGGSVPPSDGSQESNDQTQAVLDLTEEKATPAPPIDSQDLHKEKWRGPLAGVLVGATVAIPLFAIFAVILGKDADDLTDITQVLYPPLVGLVGAVIGFYFGDRRN